MAYDGYRNSQPYEQGAFNNNNNNSHHSHSPNQNHNHSQSTSSYTNPPQFRDSLSQAPYPDTYESSPEAGRFASPPHPHPHPHHQHQHPAHNPPPTSQPPLLSHSPAPPPTVPPNSAAVPEPYPDPSRFYPPNHNNAPPPPQLEITPEVIAQITASVVQQLRGLSIPSSNNNTQQARPPPPPGPSLPNPPPNTDLRPFTPSISDISSTTNKVYTPPSPYRQAPEVPYQSPQFANAQFAQNPHGFHPPPPLENTARSMFDGPHDHRPKPSRLSTQEETPVEKTWGQLFDKDGVPTARLGQLLRGIAVYLIETYPPGNTIVITPDKMQKYYEDTRPPMDPYPWKDIFDDRTSSISRLYRDMQAEHHLVQEQLDERPDIPGLTPRGFERWMRLMIIAHPEKEYQRLQRTVLEMPISNPDEPKERFPKELPRRLFPKAPDSNVKEQLERCILAHCHVELSDNAPEKDHLQANTQRPRVSSSIAPSSHNADPRLNSPFEEDEEEDEEDDDEDDDEPALLTHPIERERKPYAVQPGSGRVYDDNLKPINSPAEQAKYREFSGRNGRHSPAASGGGHSASGHKHQHQHHPSQDFAGRDAEFIKPPMSARFHGGEEGETRYREHTRDRDRHSDDRVPHAHTHAHEHVRDRGEPDGGAIPTPTAGNVRSGWDTDEEEYYRAPSAMSGRNGRHTPGTYDNGNQWPFR